MRNRNTNNDEISKPTFDIEIQQQNNQINLDQEGRFGFID